jgi:hypothetical protein
VCGGCFSGRIKCLNDMAHTHSAPSHRSDIARTRYWVGSGSKIGMVKTKVCGSLALTYKK